MHEAPNSARGRAPGGAPFLIAAVSGRPLAQSARRGGYRVVVLDCFADRDCAEAASACRAVSADGAVRLDARRLRQGAAELSPSASCGGLVYGSGFESRPALLEQLAAGRRLFGNTPAVVRAIKDPSRFFPLLDRLGIPHPETRTTPPPAASGDWLVKRIGGAGGTHIGRLDRAPTSRDVYYQRYEAGTSCSVLFLADGRRARVVGWNQQWTAGRPGLPWLFGGAVSGITLPRALEREIRVALDHLVAATGMVGLNGLDFLRDRKRWSVLEVNPRPPATAELHDPDSPRGLFALHLAACEGRLPARLPAPRAARAFSIVLAPGPWTARSFTFPAWCRDIPRASTTFAPGDPICTLHATAADPVAAVGLLQRRKSRLVRMLSRARRAVPA